MKKKVIKEKQSEENIPEKHYTIDYTDVTHFFWILDMDKKEKKKKAKKQ